MLSILLEFAAGAAALVAAWFLVFDPDDKMTACLVRRARSWFRAQRDPWTWVHWVLITIDFLIAASTALVTLGTATENQISTVSRPYYRWQTRRYFRFLRTNTSNTEQIWAYDFALQQLENRDATPALDILTSKREEMLEVLRAWQQDYVHEEAAVMLDFFERCIGGFTDRQSSSSALQHS